MVVIMVVIAVCACGLSRSGGGLADARRAVPVVSMRLADSWSCGRDGVAVVVVVVIMVILRRGSGWGRNAAGAMPFEVSKLLYLFASTLRTNDRRVVCTRLSLLQRQCPGP